ncbi:MAG: 50S ribosomal protein L10 [Asgard group archaeon]|nr:50S ribosomal protein L10 [Asgard group archaeon]
MSQAIYDNEPSSFKKKQLKELVSLLKNYETIGITRVENITSKTIQRLRHNLRGDAILKVAKNTIMQLAIDKVAEKDKGLKKLKEHIEGSAAFLLTNGNPFKIANYLEQNKIPTPAKEGQVATKDIIVTARDTGFAPGPIIGELQSVGLKTRIEGGTIHISENSTVCKAGEKVSRTLANVLGRLGEEPFDSGLSIDVIYSKGSLIEHDDLIVDFEEIREKTVQAYRHAYALSLEAAYPTKENILELIGKTRREALHLALESDFITPETAGSILAKTQLEAISLAQTLATKAPNALPEKVRSTVETTSAKSSASTASKEKEAKKTEEKDEEEDTGMGSLFG